MKLLTKAILKDLPEMYSQDGKAETEVFIKVKYFLGGWTWYATEYDPKTKTFFGLVTSPLNFDQPEWGYFTLTELESVQSVSVGGLGNLRMSVERDLYLPSNVSVADLRKAGRV